MSSYSYIECQFCAIEVHSSFLKMTSVYSYEGSHHNILSNIFCIMRYFWGNCYK